MITGCVESVVAVTLRSDQDSFVRVPVGRSPVYQDIWILTASMPRTETILFRATWSPASGLEQDWAFTGLSHHCHTTWTKTELGRLFFSGGIMFLFTNRFLSCCVLSRLRLAACLCRYQSDFMAFYIIHIPRGSFHC